MSKVTTNTATIWSFSSHWSFTAKNGTFGSGTKCCPTTTVCGRPELPSPLATTAVRLLVGWLQVIALVLVPHPEPNALTVGVRRPFGCKLFCGVVSSFRGVEGGGGAPCFGSGGGISSQSNSGARSDCFTMAAVVLLTASEDSGGLKCTPNVCRPVQSNSLNTPLEPEHYFLLRAGCFLCICNRVTSTDGLCTPSNLTVLMTSLLRRYFRPRVYFNICLWQPGFVYKITFH